MEKEIVDTRGGVKVMGKAQESPNMAAILQWCRVYRPDITTNIGKMIDHSNDGNDAFTLLLAVAFEAGRNFQHANPDCILGAIPPGDWQPIIDTGEV